MGLLLDSERLREARLQLIGLLAIVLFIPLAGCSTNKPSHVTSINTELSAAPSAGAVYGGGKYLINPGDELEIKFFYNPELNETIVVRPDGNISLQLIDEVRAAGLTPAELDEVLTTQYSSELKVPSVSVIVRTFTNQRVFVGGEVNKPSSVDLTGSMTPLQAVLAAGGLRETANAKDVLVVSRASGEAHTSYSVNLKDSMFNGGSESYLKPGDIVLVPKSGIAKANLFTDQYIRKLLLFNGFRVGYDLNNN